MTDATPEQLEMARRIVRESEDGSEIAMIVRAIQETTELAAKMLDNSTCAAKKRSIAADREDNLDSARNWTAAMVTAESAAKALRSGSHLKGQDQ